MTQVDGEAQPPFRSFRVTTEVMPDGRAIHYYDWPAGDRSVAGDASPRPADPEPPDTRPPADDV